MTCIKIYCYAIKHLNILIKAHICKLNSICSNKKAEKQENNEIFNENQQETSNMQVFLSDKNANMCV